MDNENELKLRRNERRLSEGGERAMNELFGIFNKELFGGELPKPRFLLCLVKSYVSADFSKERNVIRLMVCIREWSVYANPFTGKERFVGDCKADFSRVLVHEMCHLWQKPLKVYPEFPPREFKRLLESKNFDEIRRREALDKEYRLMHNRQFADKMRSLGIIEEYSGKDMQYSDVEQIVPDGLFQKTIENMREQIDGYIDALVLEMFSYIKPRAV